MQVAQMVVLLVVHPLINVNVETFPMSPAQGDTAIRNINILFDL